MSNFSKAYSAETNKPAAETSGSFRVPVSPAPGADSITKLRQHIEALTAAIDDAERKRAGIAAAIQSRRLALQRLQAQLALCGSGAALPSHA